MDVKRLAVSVTAPLDQERSKSLMRPTPTVLTKPVLVFSTRSPLVKTYSCLAPMYPMPLPRHHRQNRVSTCAPTGHFTTGGYSTNVAHLFLLATLSPLSQLCRVTQSHPAFGKSMPMRSFANWVYHQPPMNHVYIQVPLPTGELFSNDRSTILPSPLRTRKQLTSYLI